MWVRLLRCSIDIFLFFSRNNMFHFPYITQYFSEIKWSLGLKNNCTSYFIMFFVVHIRKNKRPPLLISFVFSFFHLLSQSITFFDFTQICSQIALQFRKSRLDFPLNTSATLYNGFFITMHFVTKLLIHDKSGMMNICTVIQDRVCFPLLIFKRSI